MMHALAAMLGIRTGAKVSIINPPPGFVHQLNPLPDGVEFLVTAASGLDLILFFTDDAKEVVARLPALSRAMALTGGIWICFPEEARRPLDEEFVRTAALDIGMVDNKRTTFDSGWRGLRLVWRDRSRPDKPEPKKRAPAAEA